MSRERRVLHVVGQLGPPSETFVEDRMVELDRLGWSAWATAEGLAEGAQVSFPPPRRRLVQRRSRRALAAAAARLRGRQLEESWWIGRAIAASRPHVVHAHFGWNALAALEPARRQGVPLVAGLHGYDVTVFPAHGLPGRQRDAAARSPHLVYRELFAGAEAVLAVSRFLAGRLRELGYERAVEVIPSGIRLRDFPFRGPREDPGRPALLFVGRLVPYKGLDVALRALAALAENGLDATLEVVGDGPCRAAWERLADDLGLRHAVSFLGAGGRDVVRTALARADIVVVPSRTVATGQAEGLGNVPKEAYATGVELVATRNGGLPEVVPPALRDELVPEGDASALATAIDRRWAERARWAHRAALAREWVEREFDWARVAPRLARVYERAVEGRR